MVAEIIVTVIGSITGILIASAIERHHHARTLHPRDRGRKRNAIRSKLGLQEKEYSRRQGVDENNPDCLDPSCTHPQHALNFKVPPATIDQTPEISPFQAQPQTVVQITPEAIIAFLNGLGIRCQSSAGWGAGFAGSDDPIYSPASSPSDARARSPPASTAQVQEVVPPKPRSPSTLDFVGLYPSNKYDVQAEVPAYDEGTYEKHLTNSEWSKEETDNLLDVYRECNGKWPVIADRYVSSRDRTMEELKARFYGISATILAMHTPITSMTAPEYNLYETLSNFNAAQETNRKKLAEGHLYRRQNEVDEETVLLGELQRIMLNQANLESERDELRRRLDHPVANTNGYQYTTSAQLTQLWQTLLQADRMKKTQRLRPTGNPVYDGFPSATPTSARPRESNAGLPDVTNMSGRRPTRDSLPSATVPQSALPADLSKAELLRFGVVQAQDKLPSGVTFASDRLSKPRIAKSSVQTDKIAAILSHVGVPDLIPLPTPPVVEQFDAIMGKVHTLLDMRKTAEKEEQELRVRSAEQAS